MLPSLSNSDHLQLIYLVSHGLRSPVTRIRWGIEVLKNGKKGSLTKDQQEFIDQLHEYTVELTHALRAILHLSRIEEGQYTLKQERLVFSEIFRKAMQSCHADSIVSMKSDCPEEVIVVADPTILQEMISSIFLAFADVGTVRDDFFVEVSCRKETVVVTFSSRSADFSKLHSSGLHTDLLEGEIVGGTPGLFLYVVAQFCAMEHADLFVDNMEDDARVILTLQKAK